LYDLEALGWGPFFSAALEQYNQKG